MDCQVAMHTSRARLLDALRVDAGALDYPDLKPHFSMQLAACTQTASAGLHGCARG
jgi:hypothetical protein